MVSDFGVSLEFESIIGEARERSGGLEDFGDGPFREPLQRLLDSLESDGRLVIDTYKGSVTVTTWDRDEVAVDVRIVADQTDELVESTDVKVHRSGRTLCFETDYDEDAWKHIRKHGILDMFSGGFSQPLVHYEIRMPRTARLDIDDYKSEIRVTGLQADLVIETYKGDIEVDDLDGSLQLETYKGTGHIAFSRLDDDSSVDTYKGNVTLAFPRNTGFDLDADLGRRGDLDSDFDLDRDRRHRNDDDDDDDGDDGDDDEYWDDDDDDDGDDDDDDEYWDDDDDDDDNVYRGAVNGGGPRLHLESYKGRIALRRAR